MATAMGKRQRTSPSPTMAVTYLTDGTKTAGVIAVTRQAIDCPPPILTKDFDDCRVPGGVDLWANAGFYSPGVCFIGYQALCTQTSLAKNEFPIQPGETVVRCVPSGYDCNIPTRDQRFATSSYGSIVLSAPAFQIRWKEQDLQHASVPLPPPTITKPTASSSIEPLPGGVTVVTVHVTPSQMGLQTTESVHPETRVKLSDAGVAGVAVGIFFGISLVVFGMLIIRRRLKRKREAELSEKDGTSARASADEPPTALLGSVELGHGETLAPMELSATAAPAELASPRECDETLAHWRTSHISLNKDPVEIG